MLSFYDRALKERLDAAPPDSQFDAWQQWRDHRLEAWETLPIRQQIIDWLNAKGIAALRAFHVKRGDDVRLYGGYLP